VSILAPGRNIVLIGLMGTGKTTIGRLVADRLGRPFVDTDAIVEQKTGSSITDLFATVGERGFREEEAAAVRHASSLRGQVIAVGGGAVTEPRNTTALRSTGDLVLLTAPPEVLRSRLSGSGAADRPLLDGAEDLAERLARLGAERAEAYRGAATATFDTAERTPEEVADAIVEWARERPGLLAREERDA
jgi:shikimate kinase